MNSDDFPIQNSDFRGKKSCYLGAAKLAPAWPSLMLELPASHG